MIVECSSLAGNLDANAPEWQCVHQIYRQNAYTIFVEKSKADLTATIYTKKTNTI